MRRLRRWIELDSQKRAPIFARPSRHPHDMLEISVKISKYKTNKRAESTPPCLTPLLTFHSLEKKLPANALKMLLKISFKNSGTPLLLNFVNCD